MANQNKSEKQLSVSSSSRSGQGLLVEILAEEFPSSFQALGEKMLADAILTQVTKAGLSFAAGAVKIFSTPRRLAVYVPRIPSMTAEQIIERKGPRNTAPQAALDGFVRSAGLTSLDQAELRDGVYYAVMRQAGRPTSEILPGVVAAAMMALRWPKSMRWRDGLFAYPRPIRNILAIYGGEVLRGGFHIGHRAWDSKTGPARGERLPGYDSDVAAMAADENFYPFTNFTYGHRFLANKKIFFRQASAATYARKLAKSGQVLASRQERGQEIVDLLYKTGLQEGLTVSDFFAFYEQGHSEDSFDLDGLLTVPLVEEVTGLVENPNAYVGKIDAAFFDLPPPVIAATIRKNQKYFLLEKPDEAAKYGTVTPRFVIIANQKASDGGAQIIAGNERVARARLADARFYWDLDRKSSLDDFAAQLPSRAYHAKLGSMADKTRRLEKLVELLAAKLDYDSATRDRAIKAAHYAKADLSSGMVGEFPELQGVMGEYYAREAGLDDKIAAAIGAQYRIGTRDGLADDGVGQAPEKIILALADHLDALVGFFGIGEKPTGSKDPFGLRRAALAVIRIILSHELSLNLHEIMVATKKIYNEQPLIALDKFDAAEITDFMAERLQSYVLEFGFPKSVFIPAYAPLDQVDRDLLLASMRVGEAGRFEIDGDLVRIKHRYFALKLHENLVRQLIPTWRRVVNILRDAETKDQAAVPTARRRADLLQLPPELALAAAIDQFAAGLKAALAADDFSTGLQLLAGLVAPLDEFFAAVTVNDTNPHLRYNRLVMLAQLRLHMLELADFSQILAG
ncbi:MAG: glycine--tRNA ligase subunit beta [Candidatus Symbiobacter sp.]|nr:glycine--tRNA ligase subunit beta [Candidatus Symbiobacter sp.]